MVLNRHWPDFQNMLDSIPDHRRRSTYQVGEIIMAGLCMFVFKHGSRNNADQSVKGHYEQNYVCLFGLLLPTMETVDQFLRKLDTEDLEELKILLVRKLIEKKVFDKWKFQSRHVVSIDGTGTHSFDKEPFKGCPHKESKNGKKVWQAYVVEAKLVCGNGFSISLASEWLSNDEDLTNKQDCEQKAFVRLSHKLKRTFPKLSLIITADGLYPNKTVFDLCKGYGWAYIIVLKEGNLKNLWQEVNKLYPVCLKKNRQEKILKKQKTGWLYESSIYIQNLEHGGHTLNWVEYVKGFKGGEIKNRFVHITNLLVSHQNVWQISQHGRLRWNIENQGFNEQKNHGYNLSHKYSHSHLGAMKNYYQLMQLAHMINQLTLKIRKVEKAIDYAGISILKLASGMVAEMEYQHICPLTLADSLKMQKQLRY